MLAFRTALLWLSFALLIIQLFVDVQVGITGGIAFRLAPSALLLIWFLTSLFDRSRLSINHKEIPALAVKAFRILRPLSSITIISGAVFKLLHLAGGNLLLYAGIFLMAVYSTLLFIYARETGKYDPDILEDRDNNE